MKLAQFTHENTRRIAKIVDGGIIDLSHHLPSLPADMISLINQWESVKDIIKDLEVPIDYRLDEIKLEAPVSRPGKIFGIGLNYADHAAEAATGGIERPEHQVWFSKAVTSINGPFDAIQLPRASDKLDYEAEMVFIIGKRCKNISESEARSAIFGFCIGNDVSVRDWQLRTGQFMIGKSFDSHAPIGPYIVTADAVDETNLGIRCYVNGEKRQESNTKYLMFDCAAQIAHLSQAMTLEPGDVIFTGTPAGVGALMSPANYLKEGDIVRVEIDQLGAIENIVAKEP